MAESLDAYIHRMMLPAPLPQGGLALALVPGAVAKIASDTGIPGWNIEATALDLGILPTRYLRNMHSITPEAQTRLLRSTVAQVGLGGLGGTIFEQLLRLGIGTLRIADGDNFEESNLNRQTLCDMDTIWRSKAQAARLAATRINPSITVDARHEFLTADTFPHFLAGCDLAIDALGGLTHRLTLQQCAAKANIPLVTGAIAGWTGYVAVIMPGQTGPAQFMGQDNGAEEKLGCPAPSVCTVATLMAAEAVRMLRGDVSPLAGKMLLMDLRQLTFETVAL
ncbi:MULTISPECIES: HesA/MoeB/ThiF family protein [Pseudodesulfovibrio]|uniref:UBA/THIF-type NAD/FAD binding protein n=1 Tax=Pseudodesulfovibrio aespoeensis (strain ATCC 700646 / DSM 10631 / Aspo-2) TaxID=643562 RepID=E6VV95_PSEA9|nr:MULTISPECIES: HesA/MoeB/ThiF family protein [Pseudodesulfovibrio]ADU62339.1 UBA/THIF-type NAD/FAD binding protein [Pseudodesulfovibrio aespoeensis Aspo-2]MCG2734097.1 HesA/MoeB/ThiF family protein [Pseudodesulfovibrio aespoeensis]